MAENLTEEEAADVRWAMSSEQGRRLVRRWMAKTGMYMSPFRMRPNVQPDERLVFNTAQAEIGKRIQADLLEAAPEMFHRMNSEAAARKALERIGKKDANEGNDE